MVVTQSRILVLSFLLTYTVAAATTATVKVGSGAPKPASCKEQFSHMVAFGDSTTDTGNAVRGEEAESYVEAMRPPYGGGYFGRPAGRFSDGRVIVDLLAQSLGHHFLPPSLEVLQRTNSTAKSSNKFISQNFAVAGATALDTASLRRLANNATAITSHSLEVQVSAFLSYVANTSHVDWPKSALVYMGEIGGNDYNYYYGRLLPRPDPTKVLHLVPTVVSHVCRQLDRLLTNAPFIKHVVVQGQYPMGCISLYLNKMAPHNFSLDSHGCVAAANQVTTAHDRLLRHAIRHLRHKHRHVTFVFFNSAAAYVHVLDHAAGYGFSDTFNPCYAPELEALANVEGPPASASAPAPPPPTYAPPSPPSPVPPKLAGACADPSVYMSWDGVHFTEAMHRTLMGHFLYGGDRFAHSVPEKHNFLHPCV